MQKEIIYRRLTKSAKGGSPTLLAVYYKQGAYNVCNNVGRHLAPFVIICYRRMKEPRILQIGNLIKQKGRKNPQRGRLYSANGIAPTIHTQSGGQQEPLIRIDKMKEYDLDFRIRKFTPREIFRLMDVDDEDINKIQEAGISMSQQYKMAGNSIVVSCLYHIFHNMFISDECQEPTQLTLF